MILVYNVEHVNSKPFSPFAKPVLERVEEDKLLLPA